MDFENEESVPMEDYLKMIGLKTAVLIACSAKLGAIIAGADPKSCEMLYRYGYDLGLAFQIADDWLDTYADPKVFGKAIGGDILNNKKNWLMTRAFEKASASIRQELLSAMSMPIETEKQKAAKIKATKDIYEELGLDEEAKQEIQRLHSQAMDHINVLNLPKEKADTLRNYAATLLGRNK
jgi:geranylgeranyl diphosphate synthase type II